MWKKWKKFALFVMNIWAFIFLSLFYIVLLIPFAFFLKTFFKNTLLGHGRIIGGNTYWVKREKITPTIQWAREQ